MSVNGFFGNAQRLKVIILQTLGAQVGPILCLDLPDFRILSGPGGPRELEVLRLRLSHGQKFFKGD